MKALSFFSGAMGLDLGLEQAGIETLLVSEIEKNCQNTIRKNQPNIPILGDIRNYSAADILSAVNFTPQQPIDLIVGGPPCQAFSTAGKRKGFEDERGNVFLKYIELILNLSPRYAVIENVRGLLSAPLVHRPHHERGEGYPPLTPEEEKGGALYHIVSLLRQGGYDVSFNLYNSANFGTPQTRERVVIICSKSGRVPYLEPTHAQNGEHDLPKWRTFREGVKGLDTTAKHYIHFPEKRLRYYRMLQPGQYWKHLPPDIQKEALGKSYYSGGGKTGFLRRLSWDKPSPTLVTHPAMPATDLAHPTEDRPLSIEEYKRIQEFPDDWIIEGSLLNQYKQVGNAVPVGLGRAIGSAIKKHAQGQQTQTYWNFNYSRYKDTDDQSWQKIAEHSHAKSNIKKSQLQLILA